MMELLRDDRAQSVQVGAVLLFGILILGMTMYQVTVIPQEDSKIEFDAYQVATNDMSNLRSDLLVSAGRGIQGETTVRTGVRYPVRMLFVDPAPPAGAIRTGDGSSITLSNVSATAAGSDVADYWNGNDRSFAAQSVEFVPAYNRIELPSVVVTGQIAYRKADENTFPQSSQTLIRGDRISLVAIAGDVDANGQSVTITTEPVSASTRTVTVTGDGEDITLSVPSAIPANAWEDDLLAGEPNVVEVIQNDTRVDIVLDGTVTYNLRLSKVEVREKTDGGRAPETNATYLVKAAGDDQTIGENQTASVTAEVRDEFNNPKENVTVTFTTPNDELTAVTDEEGRATVSYDPDSTGTKSISAEFDDGSTAAETTSFTVYVSAAGDGSETEDAIDGGHPMNVTLQRAELDGSGNIDLTFENDGTENWTAVETRIPMYYSGHSKPIVRADYVGTTLEISDRFVALDSRYQVREGETTTVRIDSLVNSDGGAVDAGQSHFVVLTVLYENDSGDRRSSTYYAHPRP